MSINLNDIDIDIEIKVKLRSKSIPSTAQQIEINQEEIRINYYLDHLGNKIEKMLRDGKKIDMNFIEINAKHGEG